MDAHAWLDVSRSALEHAFVSLRRLCGPGTRFAPVVKANAYGHGLRLCAEVFASLGVDMLCVNEIAEARAISDLGPPIYLLGPTWPQDAEEIADVGCHVVSSSLDHVEALAAAGSARGRAVPVHVKVETGTNRQGLQPAAALDLCQRIRALPGVALHGFCTHLADVEDETEHTFARVQLARFSQAAAHLPAGVIRHCASSAAHMLFPDARYDMVRPGIACYGLWPSPETRISAEILHGDTFELVPALTWKTRVAQVKEVVRGAYVGYGRTHRLRRPSRLAVLPVGYYDGYDRQLSGSGVVLVRGRRAPVTGRICMNMCMVDVTDIPGVVPGDEVVLIGEQGSESVTADDVARTTGTINYEVTTRIEARLPRKLVG